MGYAEFFYLFSTYINPPASSKIKTQIDNEVTKNFLELLQSFCAINEELASSQYQRIYNQLTPLIDAIRANSDTTKHQELFDALMLRLGNAGDFEEMMELSKKESTIKREKEGKIARHIPSACGIHAPMKSNPQNGRQPPLLPLSSMRSSRVPQGAAQVFPPAIAVSSPMGRVAIPSTSQKLPHTLENAHFRCAGYEEITRENKKIFVATTVEVNAHAYFKAFKYTVPKRPHVVITLPPNTFNNKKERRDINQRVVSNIASISSAIIFSSANETLSLTLQNILPHAQNRLNTCSKNYTYYDTESDTDIQKMNIERNVIRPFLQKAFRSGPPSQEIIDEAIEKLKKELNKQNLKNGFPVSVDAVPQIQKLRPIIQPSVDIPLPLPPPPPPLPQQQISQKVLNAGESILGKRVYEEGAIFAPLNPPPPPQRNMDDDDRSEGELVVDEGSDSDESPLKKPHVK